MSNFQEATDWWEGADGKWYPPVAKKTDAAPVVQSEISAPASKVKRRHVRVYLSGVAAIVILATGAFLYLTRTEFRYAILEVELIDASPDSGKWSVLPDCSKQGNFVSSPCSCVLSVGYSDLNDSTPVIVFGATGNEVGRTDLGGGIFFHTGGTSVRDYNPKEGRGCRWNPFNLRVPDNEKYYVVKVGTRGEVKTEFEGLFPLSLKIEDD